MKIGLYGEPTNSLVPKYRGLYRQNDIIDMYESHNQLLVKELEWFLSQSREGMYVEYTKERKERLEGLFSDA